MLKKLKSFFRSEESHPSHPLVAMYAVGQPLLGKPQLPSLTRGRRLLRQCRGASLCADDRAEAAASVPLTLYKGEAELATHPFPRSPAPAQPPSKPAAK